MTIFALDIPYRLSRAAPALACVLSWWIFPLTSSAATEEFGLGLDAQNKGGTPAGWRADATRPTGPLASWAIEQDSGVAGNRLVLTIRHIRDPARGVFNLFWSDQYSMRNGEIEVRVRANTGRIDQGGGVMWRVRDANNYYVARYNPLERNFRLYYVKDGNRVMLASAEPGEVEVGEWFHLKVVHHDRRIRGWFNGRLAWEVTDQQLPEAGGVGIWSKADAASSFMGFKARRLAQTRTRVPDGGNDNVTARLEVGQGGDPATGFRHCTITD